jgi:ATP-dependent Lon protease
MTGEITIMGKVLAIGGVLPKLQAPIDARCKEVIMPRENERDVQMTPDYVKYKIKSTSSRLSTKYFGQH